MSNRNRPLDRGAGPGVLATATVPALVVALLGMPNVGAATELVVEWCQKGVYAGQALGTYDTAKECDAGRLQGIDTDVTLVEVLARKAIQDHEEVS